MNFNENICQNFIQLAYILTIVQQNAVALKISHLVAKGEKNQLRCEFPLTKVIRNGEHESDWQNVCPDVIPLFCRCFLVVVRSSMTLARSWLWNRTYRLDTVRLCAYEWQSNMLIFFSSFKYTLWYLEVFTCHLQFDFPSFSFVFEWKKPFTDWNGIW